jgi:hypothetical protein
LPWQGELKMPMTISLIYISNEVVSMATCLSLAKGLLGGFNSHIYYNTMITLESYQQTYAYDTGNNLTNLSHQANSNTWQQALTIHPNNNHGTETQLAVCLV